MLKVGKLHNVGLKPFERKTALAKYVVDVLCEADKRRLIELMHSVLIYKVEPEDAADDVPTRLALKTYKKICLSALPIMDERINQMLRAVSSDPNTATVDDILSGEVFDMVAAYTSELWQKARLPISAPFVESLLRVLLRCCGLDVSGLVVSDVADLIRQRALQCVRAYDG
ncbi:hypothetical protein AAVH_11213 [Aphelenchoides avenae]|nr:hypothetical protein AAVH_11213 [Aphelenchus avenae]